MAKISAYSEQTDPADDDTFVMVRAGVNYKIKLSTLLEYTPAAPADWGSPEPSSIIEALDILAATAGTALPPDGAYGQITVSSSGTVWNVTEATLAALAATAWAANTLPIGTGADTLSQVSFSPNEFPARASTGNLVAKPITDFALTILDDNNATDVRGTINAQEADADLTTIAGLAPAQGDILYRDSSAWALLGPGTAGHILKTGGAGANPSWIAPSSATSGYVVVATATVSGSAVTSIDFTSLDLNAHHTYVVRFGIKNATASVATLSMFYNNDTTATNYRTESIGAAHTNDAVISAVDVAANGGTLGKVEVYMPPSSERVRAISTYVFGPFTTAMENSSRGHQWTTTGANITQITFTASVASSIGIGSYIEIWRYTP